MVLLIVAEIVVLVILLALSGFFSSAEVAFFSLDAIRLKRIEETDIAASEKMKKILETPTRLLSTILIGNTLVNVCASIIGFALFTHVSEEHAEAISIAVMTLLLLIFGEVGPKRVAMLIPERMAAAYAPILLFLIPLFKPLRAILERITQTFKDRFHPKAEALTEEEFESVVEFSEEEGVLDEEERAMVKAIIKLESLQASDVMTPRVDLIGIDLNDLPNEPVDFVRSAKVRHLLLYNDQLDNVDGLLDVRKFMLDPEHNMENAWVAPLYVPEFARLDDLLERFLNEGQRAAVVVDEYGGTAGVISRGDILEEIVGEIGDEYDEHKLVIEDLGNERWLVDGSVSLEDINERLGFDLDGEGADRIAGWIIRVAERLPRAGETVEAEGCKATVQRVRKHRIELTLLERSIKKEGVR